MPDPVEKNAKTDPVSEKAADHQPLDKWLSELGRAGKSLEPARPEDLSQSILNTRIITAGNECYRCHPKRESSFDYKPLNYGEFSTFESRLEKKKERESSESREARLASEFEKAPAHEKLITVFSRLPQKASVHMGNDSLSLTTDFAGAVEAVPGIKLDSATKNLLSSLESIGLQKDAFTAQFKSEMKIPLDQQYKGVGVVKEMRVSDPSGKLNFDLQMLDGQLSMKKISGLALVKEDGKEIRIHNLTVKSDGKKSIAYLTVDNPGEKPDMLPESLWPATLTVPIGLDDKLPEGGKEVLNDLLKVCSDARKVLKDRNFAPYLSGIEEPGLRNTAEKLLAGASSLRKDGDQITITRDNGQISHDLGGPSLKLSSFVQFRIGSDPKAPALSDISGVTVGIPLPPELKMGDSQPELLKSVSLSSADGKGHRNLSISMGPLVDRVGVTLDQNMQPLRDGDGNMNAYIRVANLLSSTPQQDRLGMNLRIGANGQLNMKPSELMDIAADASSQAADLSFTGAALGVVSVPTRIISGAAWLFGY